jgi:hypothetical protein
MTLQHAKHSLTIDSQVNDASSGGGLTDGKEVTLENRFIVPPPPTWFKRAPAVGSHIPEDIHTRARARRVCLKPAVQVLQFHDGFF